MVRGWKVEHWLNGKQVIALDLASPEGKAAIAESKFKDWPKFASLPKWHIAFQDHGHPARTVDRDLDGANQVIAELGALGISVPEECERQLAAGVTSFAGSLDTLFQLLGERRAALK